MRMRIAEEVETYTTTQSEEQLGIILRISGYE